jgi:quinol monooxygenase YgiN
LIGLVAPARKEAGCLSYDFHCALDNPAKFLSCETWASKAQADAHLQSPHVVALLPRVDELCVAFPQITESERIS